MNLAAFAGSIRDHVAIKKKFLLHDVLKELKETRFNTQRVHRDIGEDAAAIHFGDALLLVSTDMISSDYARRHPRAAGYSAILVGIDDIYASGGRPVAATLDVQCTSTDDMLEVVRGAKAAAEQFSIAIVRGHSSLHESCTALASTIFGETPAGCHVSAGTAREDQVLVLVWDDDGRRSPNGPYWDTVTFKPPGQATWKRDAMVNLARAGLLRSSKDVSDAGLFGTILMMMDYSRAGAIIDIESLMAIFNVTDLESLHWWTTAYLTTGFITSADRDDIDRIQAIAREHSMRADEIGLVTGGQHIRVSWRGEDLLLFDREVHRIFP